MSMLDKLKKNSKIKESSALSDSEFFSQQESVSIDVPMLNVALSGTLDKGLSSGLLVLAGPSKHFKTSFALKMASQFLKADPEAVMLFYDSEFGSPQEYFETFQIDVSRVLHTPITNVEELKFDLISQLEQLDKKDKVIIVIDSIGNLASKKELEDAINEKSVADMSRAKALKGLFRMTTPYLRMKNIPLLAINHTYQSMELFSKAIVSGGCVVAGTKIKTPNGLVEIQNIEEGDLISHKSGTMSVLKTWNPETLTNGNPECFEIEFEDGHKVICSDEHKFLVDGEWIEAKSLKVDMDCEVV